MRARGLTHVHALTFVNCGLLLLLDKSATEIGMSGTNNDIRKRLNRPGAAQQVDAQRAHASKNNSEEEVLKICERIAILEQRLSKLSSDN